MCLVKYPYARSTEACWKGGWVIAGTPTMIVGTSSVVPEPARGSIKIPCIQTLLVAASPKLTNSPKKLIDLPRIKPRARLRSALKVMDIKLQFYS